MAETVSQDIDGVSYSSTPFPPFAGIGLAFRLSKVVGPALAGLASGIVSGGASLALDPVALATALQGGFAALNAQEAQALTLALLQNTWQGPTPNRPTQLQLNTQANFDAAFLGNFAAIWPAVGLALRANDFFGFGGIGKLLKRAPTPPSSPAPSTPSSSGS